MNPGKPPGSMHFADTVLLFMDSETHANLVVKVVEAYQHCHHTAWKNGTRFGGLTIQTDALREPACMEDAPTWGSKSMQFRIRLV